MPSIHNVSAMKQTRSSSLMGKMHASMSRQVMRLEVADCRAQANQAKSNDEFYYHTLEAEKKAAILEVRDAWSCVTKPMDGLFGTGRQRTPEIPPHSYDHFEILVLEPANYKLAQAKQHFGDVGVVGFLATGIFALPVIVGAGIGAVLVTPFKLPIFEVCTPGGVWSAGATTGAVWVGLCSSPIYGLGIIAREVAAAPSAGLKLLGNFRGKRKAGQVAERKARELTAAFCPPIPPTEPTSSLSCNSMPAAKGAATILGANKTPQTPSAASITLDPAMKDDPTSGQTMHQ